MSEESASAKAGVSEKSCHFHEGDHAPFRDGEDHHQDHAHSQGWDLLEAARIGIAGIAAVCLWFVDAFFFTRGSTGELLHDFFARFEVLPVLAISEYIPAAVWNALPTSLANWIDYYLAIRGHGRLHMEANR